MIEVLTSNNNNLLIGIPKIAFTIDENITPENKTFWQRKGKRFRKIMCPFLTKDDRIYGSGEVSLLYSYCQNYDFERYFEAFRSIWNNKDITLITGRSVFDKITYNIFDNAKSVSYILAPSINAFEEYDQILSSALTTDKEKLIIAILGPTATILAYDLCLAGYQALDLGHIAKSYDFYKKGIHPGGSNCKFYKPD